MELEASIDLSGLHLGAGPRKLAVTFSPSIRKQISHDSQSQRGRAGFFFSHVGRKIPGLMAKLCPQMPSMGI
jgi:hypothetical protein